MEFKIRTSKPFKDLQSMHIIPPLLGKPNRMFIALDLNQQCQVTRQNLHIPLIRRFDTIEDSTANLIPRSLLTK